MDKQRWDRVKEIFGEAIERPREEREAFLDAACGDPQLRADVDAMLVAHSQAGGFLETPAGAAQAALEDLAGQRLGPYRIEAELGRGGMGVVYRAVRDDEAFEKTVAIKVVAHAGDEVHRRFEQERRILGRLQHPNIAAILDGGRTPQGAPYLVMELVDGEPIDAYCRTRRLATRERLALFRTVCAAVSYAHQSLVVHRDLKPGNILVTAAGDPKLLDFGIAKLLADGGDPAKAPTATLLPALTPAYASPEQVKNEPITTASDVYSLGVILYELLTGRLPYRPESPSLPDLIEAVCETAPMAPSAAALAAGEGSLATRAELAGDLDTIVMKALRKEPERRYGSVVELSEDLRRHLDGRPVQARGDAVGYRLGKFARRHRLELGAAAAVLLALVAGVVATARQARIAEHERAAAERQRAVADRRFQEARDIARVFIADMDPAIRHLAGATPVRRLIVDKGLLYLNRLAADAEAGGDSGLVVDLANGYVLVGDILGHPDHPNLGDPAGARTAYERAMALATSVVAREPANPDARRRLWAALHRLGRLAGTQGDVPRGLALLRQAVAVVDGSLALTPDDVELPRDRSTTLRYIAWLQLRARDNAAALATYREGLDAALAFRAAHPEHPEAARDVVVAYMGVANSAIVSERLDDGVAAAQAGVELADAATRAAPDNAQARRDLSFTLDLLVQGLVRSGRVAEAVPHAERSLALAESLAAADPRNVQARRDVINGLRNLGVALAEAGRPKDALVRHERGVALAEAAVAASPDDRLLRENLAASLHALGLVRATLGDHASAARALARAVEVKEELTRAAPGDAWGRTRLADMLDALAGVREKLGDTAGARASRDRAATLRAGKP